MTVANPNETSIATPAASQRSSGPTASQRSSKASKPTKETGARRLDDDIPLVSNTTKDAEKVIADNQAKIETFKKLLNSERDDVSKGRIADVIKGLKIQIENAREKISETRSAFSGRVTEKPKACAPSSLSRTVNLWLEVCNAEYTDIDSPRKTRSSQRVASQAKGKSKEVPRGLAIVLS